MGRFTTRDGDEALVVMTDGGRGVTGQMEACRFYVQAYRDGVAIGPCVKVEDRCVTEKRGNKKVRSWTAVCEAELLRLAQSMTLQAKTTHEVTVGQVG
jgi:hypothetical protein